MNEAITPLKRAFLPAHDPIIKLPEVFSPWQDAVDNLPAYLAAGVAREEINKLPLLNTTPLNNTHYEDLALAALSLLATAFVNENWSEATETYVPRNIAIPLASVADHLERAPALTYFSHTNYNWRLLNPELEPSLKNLAINRHFYGGLDESWFLICHIFIEFLAVPITDFAQRIDSLHTQENFHEITKGLDTVAKQLHQMNDTLKLMRTYCEPDVFFTRIQPFFKGMNNVVYEGVSQKPFSFPGGSGAQSALLPCVDALLGIKHAEDDLMKYLKNLRRFMPKEQEIYLSHLEETCPLRQIVIDKNIPQMTKSYNECIYALGEFRHLHVVIAIDYIQKPSNKINKKECKTGTGGSPFAKYLNKHKKETIENKIII